MDEVVGAAGGEGGRQRGVVWLCSSSGSQPSPPRTPPFLLQMYILRKVIETKLREHKIFEDDCYFCSLSSKTIVYKGQLTPEQVGGGCVYVWESRYFVCCVWGASFTCTGHSLPPPPPLQPYNSPLILLFSLPPPPPGARLLPRPAERGLPHLHGAGSLALLHQHLPQLEPRAAHAPAGAQRGDQHAQGQQVRGKEG